MPKQFAYAFPLNYKIVVSLETEESLDRRVRRNSTVDHETLKTWLQHNPKVGEYVELEYDLVTRTF